MKLKLKLKLKGKEIILGGDKRCDSPGHSAKHGSYTFMDLMHNKIIDIGLVQVGYNDFFLVI